MSVKIITDSCCDLPIQYLEAHQEILEVLGMPVHINGVDYIDDLGKTLDHNTFYGYLRKGIMPTTSQINAYRFEEAFRTNVELGHEVIYIGFSSGLSGTFNSACVAKSLVLEEYPEAKIEVVDTLSASVGLGALLVEILKNIKENTSIEDLKNWIEANRMNFNHWFGVDDLNYLKSGGRISAASAMVGTVLNVKPTLILDSEGKIKPYGSVRGRKKSMAFLVSKLEAHLKDRENISVVLGHGNCPEDAEILRDMIQKQINPYEIIVSELSMTIASHVGPNMIAVAFLGDSRENI